MPTRIRELRHKAGLTLRELSELTGVSITALSYAERGVKTPGLDLACNVADALGVSLDVLAGREPICA